MRPGAAAAPAWWAVLPARGGPVLGLLGFGVVAVFAVVALAIPLLPSLDAFATGAHPLQPPSVKHPMGTDDLGRDVLSQLLWGSRVSLLVGVVCAVLSTALGVLIGSAAGYFGGWLDDFLMRVTEVFMILPRLLLAVVVIAILGAGLWSIVFVIAILSWPATARLVRGEFMSLSKHEFVQAARSLGQPEWKIVFREILPNSFPPVLVNVSLEVGAAIILEAGLSFLGLGDPTRMSWGTILNNAQRFLEEAWWLSVFPGAAIFLTVLGFNFLGDSLNDLLNPRLRAG